jgi:hypothetical protein
MLGVRQEVQRAEGDTAVLVLVFSSADPDGFVSHVARVLR